MEEHSPKQDIVLISFPSLRICIKQSGRQNRYRAKVRFTRSMGGPEEFVVADLSTTLQDSVWRATYTILCYYLIGNEVPPDHISAMMGKREQYTVWSLVDRAMMEAFLRSVDLYRHNKDDPRIVPGLWKARGQ